MWKPVATFSRFLVNARQPRHSAGVCSVDPRAAELPARPWATTMGRRTRNRRCQRQAICRLGEWPAVALPEALRRPHRLARRWPRADLLPGSPRNGQVRNRQLSHSLPRNSLATRGRPLRANRRRRKAVGCFGEASRSRRMPHRRGRRPNALMASRCRPSSLNRRTHRGKAWLIKMRQHVARRVPRVPPFRARRLKPRPLRAAPMNGDLRRELPRRPARPPRLAALRPRGP